MNDQKGFSVSVIGSDRDGVRSAKEDLSAVLSRLNGFGFSGLLEYRASAAWIANKERFVHLKLLGCHVFGEDGILSLHHRTYASACEEAEGDVFWLCRDCHASAHRNLFLVRNMRGDLAQPEDQPAERTVTHTSFPSALYRRFRSDAAALGWAGRAQQWHFLDVVLDYVEMQPSLFRNRLARTIEATKLREVSVMQSGELGVGFEEVPKTKDPA